MRFMMICVALLVLAEATSQAGPPRRNRQRYTPMVMSESAPVQKQEVVTSRYFEPSEKATTGSDDALQEVNAERAKRGLRAFLPDPLLNQGARKAAKIRAANQIHGHLSSDFDQLPPGAQATAAGCGALEPSWGWGSCCTYDDYTYAGAAWVMGTDGRRYMHLFVR